jgi:hypothetical protein
LSKRIGRIGIRLELVKELAGKSWRNGSLDLLSRKRSVDGDQKVENKRMKAVYALAYRAGPFARDASWKEKNAKSKGLINER